MVLVLPTLHHRRQRPVRVGAHLHYINERFITGADRPDALMIAGRDLYWTDRGNGTIGRANLDGSNVNPHFRRILRRPTGLAI